MSVCIIHEGMADDDREYTICRRCQPRAYAKLAALQGQMDRGELDPANTEDPAVAGYRILSVLLPPLTRRRGS